MVLSVHINRFINRFCSLSEEDKEKKFIETYVKLQVTSMLGLRRIRVKRGNAFSKNCSCHPLKRRDNDRQD